jgi:hypothetical protein
MKTRCITFLALLMGSSLLSAQNSSYESWRKQKAQEYARWQELREETGDLKTSKEQQAVSRFIDEGFGRAPATNSAPPTPTSPARVSSDMRVWVVVVGVASYRHIPGLNYTDDDAYRMYAFYKSPEGGSLPDGQVRVLIDEDATRSNVMQAMNEVYMQAASNDAIVFYFSGHGARSAFITQEYNGMSTDNKGLLMHREIQAVFDKSPARFKYVIADACHSGNWAQRETQSAYYQTFEESGGAPVLLLSSMGDEYSIENSGIRQGVFSHFLIRGLKGEADTNHDQVVSISELYRYVDSNVVAATNHRQNPVLSGNYMNNPPVSVVRKMSFNAAKSEVMISALSLPTSGSQPVFFSQMVQHPRLEAGRMSLWYESPITTTSWGASPNCSMPSLKISGLGFRIPTTDDSITETNNVAR